MQRNQKRTKDLEAHLKRECGVYAQYIEALDSERKAVTKFRTDEIFAGTSKRGELMLQMEQLQTERFALVQDLPDGTKRKLSDLVVEHMHQDDQRVLLPLVEKLRKSVVKARKAEVEFKQILNFSMNLVCGTASLIGSGNQSVTKAYTKRGALRETFTPPLAGSPMAREA